MADQEYSTDDETPSREFRVYNAIIFEVPRGEKLYALSLGEWFEITQEFVWRRSTGNLIRSSITTPLRWTTHDLEKPKASTMNGPLEAGSGGRLALLDARTVRYGGGRSSIEICDLLSSDRAFVHVKAKTKSSTLSHLFAQGLNSAQAFRDRRFRQLAREHCPASHHFIFDDEPRIADHTVTFAVITRTPGELRAALPFFSKQSLVNAAGELSNMGYQVRLKKISVADAPRT